MDRGARCIHRRHPPKRRWNRRLQESWAGDQRWHDFCAIDMTCATPAATLAFRQLSAFLKRVTCAAFAF